jgi:hypothetical protein
VRAAGIKIWPLASASQRRNVVSGSQSHSELMTRIDVGVSLFMFGNKGRPGSELYPVFSFSGPWTMDIENKRSIIRVRPFFS